MRKKRRRNTRWLKEGIGCVALEGGDWDGELWLHETRARRSDKAAACPVALLHGSEVHGARRVDEE